MKALPLSHRAPTQLWREARTQRSALVSLPLAILALVAGLVVLTRRDMISSDIGLELALLCSFAATLLIQGSECVAGELARGTLPSLERTPGGLKANFTSKLVLFLAGTIATCLLGPLAYALAESHSFDSATRMIASFQEPARFAQFVLPAIGLSFWVFAASAWSPSGVLALPTALLLTVALVGAFWFTPRPFSAFAMHTEDAFLFVPAYVVGGYLAARWSFVHGLAGSGTKGRAALVGIRASSFVLLPAFLAVALRPSIDSIGSGRPSLQVQDAVLDASGEQILLWSTHRASSMHWLLERLPGFDSLWKDLPHRDRLVGHHVTIDLVSAKWNSTPAVGNDQSPLAFQEAYFEIRKALRQLPDLSEHRIPEQALGGSWIGMGRLVVNEGAETLLWDPVRDLVMPLDEIVDPNYMEQVVVRRTDWLVRRQSHREVEPLTWLRHDPLLRTWEKALGLGFHPLARWMVLADDRVLSIETEGVFLVDPVTGDRRLLHFPTGEVVVGLVSANRSVRPQEQDPIVVNAFTKAGWTLALLDAEHAVVTPLSPTTPRRNSQQPNEYYLGRLQDGRLAALLQEPARIVLIEPDGSGLEQVFP